MRYTYVPQVINIKMGYYMEVYYTAIIVDRIAIFTIVIVEIEDETMISIVQE